jgi:two-component system response regulator RegA
MNRDAPVTSAEQRPSILVVDDDDVFRRRLARALRDRGFDTREAPDAAEAVASARHDSPEMAVVDLRMPGGSGLGVLQELRAIDPATRVLMLTGYGSIANAVEAMRLGAVGYVTKPADAEDILSAFARADAPSSEPAGSAPSTPSLARAEWEHIQRVLADSGGNLSEAARRLGIHRRSLQRKLGKLPPRA